MSRRWPVVEAFDRLGPILEPLLDARVTTRVAIEVPDLDAALDALDVLIDDRAGACVDFAAPGIKNGTTVLIFPGIAGTITVEFRAVGPVLLEAATRVARRADGTVDPMALALALSGPDGLTAVQRQRLTER